ncbi:MAG: hypothetical protein K8T20_12250 [Planctomycetes bacterium]|nr:hypothetical protein [Planctomycetota bacterium]
MKRKRELSRLTIVKATIACVIGTCNLILLGGCKSCETRVSADEISRIPHAIDTCFSPDGHTCLSLTRDGKIVKTDLSTGVGESLACGSSFAACLKMSSDGEVIAALTADGGVFIWRQSVGEMRIVKVDTDLLTDICFDDLMQVYCLSRHGEISVIVGSEARPVTAVADCIGLLSVRTSSSSGVICDVLLRDGRLAQVQNSEWLKLVRIADVSIRLYDYSAQGKKVAVFTASSGIGKLQISELSGLTIVFPEPPSDLEGMVISIAISNDAKFVVLGTSGGDLILIDATTGRELGRSSRNGDRIEALALSNDNRLLAITTYFQGTLFCETEELFGDFVKK